MPPRADAPASRRPAPAALAALLATLLLLPAAALSEPAPGSPESYLDAASSGRRRMERILAVGPEFPVVGGESVLPQVAAYADVPWSLQVGLKASMDFAAAGSGYDYLPQAGLHLRKLWLSDQDTSSIRNSEYISLAAGAYPSYDFKGDRTGPRPFGAIHLGKYWMPFDDLPYGLDFSLELTRYFLGHPPGKGRVHFLSASVNLFVAMP